jgi:hypothetical protein
VSALKGAKSSSVTSINLAAFQASGDAWIKATINDYSHETREKTRNIIFLV